MSDESISVQLKMFDPRSLKAHSTILIFGPRKSGKSVLMKDLLYNMNKNKDTAFDMGFFLCGSKEAREDLKDIIPSNLNLDFSIEKWITNWTVVKKLEERLIAEDSRKGYNCLIGLDDCTYDKRLMKGKEFRELAMNGRHYKVTPIICMQYCMDMGPDIRGNIDFIFVTKQTKPDVIMKIYKYFFGSFGTFDKFRKVLDVCTNNYEVLVLDCTVRHSNRVEDCVYFYKAQHPLPPFKLFSNRAWEMNRAVMGQKNKIDGGAAASAEKSNSPDQGQGHAKPQDQHQHPQLSNVQHAQGQNPDKPQGGYAKLKEVLF